MDELIKELNTLISNKLYITALNTALIVPDICSALQSSNGKTNGKKYANWFNTYVSDKYNGNIYGSDIYKIRCASLHQGHFNSEYDYYDIVIFQPTTTGIVLHNSISSNNGGKIETALIINIELFIDDIIQGVNQWLLIINENPFYNKNRTKSFSYHPNGLSPHFLGIPVLA